MHLSTVRQHYKQGFGSVLRLIEQLEMEIENLTLAYSSKHHDKYLRQTINIQKAEIERLNEKIENKSQQLLDSQRSNYPLRKAYQFHQKEKDNLNRRWQHKLDMLENRLTNVQQSNQQLHTKIRELEKCLESDTAPPVKLNSHNSSIPPSLDPPWNKPPRTKSLRRKSGKRVGGVAGHRGSTLQQVSDPNQVIIHRVDVCRHEESKTGKQKIIAGGGGAFLHPTHNENLARIGKRDLYDLKASFPDPKTSAKLGWKNCLFPLLNPWFGIVTAVLYLLTARAFLSDLGGLGLSEVFQALGVVIHDALVQPISLYWVLAIFIGFLVFTDTYSRWYRFIAGPLHGIAHLTAVFLISWGASYFVSGGQGLNFASNYQLLSAELLILIGGYLIGSLIMGVYLFISLNFFGRHHNEAFSSLKIADYKNFLRLKIEENGDLVIYPVGVRKVAKKWKDNSDLKSESRIVPDDSRATLPELIEEPIIVTKSNNNLKSIDFQDSVNEQNNADVRIKPLE